jgi:hypothetical protein
VHSRREGPDLDEAPSEILRDLATVLAQNQAVYLRLGPEGAVLSVKGAETFAFGEAIDLQWHGMTPEERARAVLKWIRKAAKYCRNPRIRWVPA